MKIDKIVDGIELKVLTEVSVYLLKKIFLNEKAKAFYERVWQTTQILFIFLLGWVTLFLVSKSKMPANTKLGISLTILLGLALLVFLTKVKKDDVKFIEGKA